LGFSLSSNIAFAQQPGIAVNGESSIQLENMVPPDVAVAPPEAPRIIIASAQSAASTGVMPPDGFDQRLPRRIIIASAQTNARTDLGPRPPVPGGTGPGTRIKFHGAQQEQKATLPAPALRTAVPASVGPPQRVVVFLQGIASHSDCPDGQGFLDQAPSWLEDYLRTDPLVKSEAAVVDYAYFSYSGNYCGEDATVPQYSKMDSCPSSGDISGAYFRRLKELVEDLAAEHPNARLTLVSHSQGGLIASYYVGKLIQDDPDFVRDRIASVITFDSFPEGIPFGRAAGTPQIEMWLTLVADCGKIPDLTEWVHTRPTALIAGGAALTYGDDRQQVAFYTLDAANGPVVPQWTQIRGSRFHQKIMNADHGEIWNVSTPGKQQLVGCAIVLAHTCNLSRSESLILTGQTQAINAVVPPGSIRAVFTIGWPGGTLKLTPIAPNGVRMDSSNLPFGSLHRAGADFETYQLIGPPAGDWTLEVSGEDVPPEGAPVTVLIDFKSPPNEPPLADAGTFYEASEGEAVVLSALGSSDPDGRITQYQWDLNADGQYEASGGAHELVVDDNGQFIVGLRVTDNSGGIDTATAEVVVNNVPPTLTVSAGQSVVPDEEVRIELASFTDPSNLDAYTASIDWGDGTPLEVGNITIPSPGAPGSVGGIGGLVTGSHTFDNPGEYTVAIEVCDDDQGCDSDSLRVTVIGPWAADPSFKLHADSADGAIGLKLGIDQIFDPVTDPDLAAALESFQAQLTYDGSCLEILAVRGLDFATNSVSIDNVSGITTFSGTAPGGVPVPAGLGHALTRLIASNQITCDMTLQVTSLTAASLTGDEGNPVTVTSSIVRSLRRGDARADQVINIADAMFIAQGLAGLRTACTGTEDATCMHSVNAASVRPDGAFDRTTIADARFIARYLTGLMDEIYQFIP
jgi:pimeloyl-ACP methyl ester carboxylesterase